jgi:hypothetical protein
MKKSALPAALLLFGVGLGVSGCPVYDGGDVGCFSDQDCPDGYLCDTTTTSCVAEQANRSPTCNSPDDCGTNETCARSGTCVSGDCHFKSVGCVNGYACSSTTGRWECLEQGPGSNGGASSGGAASVDGGATTDGGAPAAMSTAGAGG